MGKVTIAQHNRVLVNWFTNIKVGTLNYRKEHGGIYDAANIYVHLDGRVSLFKCETGGMCPILPEQITEMRRLR